MVNFDVFFFSEPFDLSEVTAGRLQRYSSEHARLMAANPRYAHLAEPSIAMHEKCFGLFAEEDIKTTISETSTQMMLGARQAFLDMVSQYEGGVRMIWGKGSPEYQRFYPGGISEYHRANLQNIDEKLIRYERAVLEFQSKLPQDFINAFLAQPTKDYPGGVIHRFRAARKAQLGAKGEKTQSGEEFDKNRAKLEALLLRNLLLVAAEVTGGSELEKLEARRLFPQHILKKVKRKKKGDKAEAGNDDEEDDDTETDAGSQGSGTRDQATQDAGNTATSAPAQPQAQAEEAARAESDATTVAGSGSSPEASGSNGDAVVLSN